MAFKTGEGSDVSFDRAFEAVEGIAVSVKQLSTQLQTKSANGTLTGSDVVRYFTDLGGLRNKLDEWVARFTDAAAATAFARDRYNDPAYDPIAEYNAFNTEIDNTLTFIATNIPTDLLTWDAVNGVVTWNAYTPEQTATLRTQLQTLINTVD